MTVDARVWRLGAVRACLACTDGGRDAGGDSDGEHSDNDAFLSARENNSDWYRSG